MRKPARLCTRPSLRPSGLSAGTSLISGKRITSWSPTWASSSRASAALMTISSRSICNLVAVPGGKKDTSTAAPFVLNFDGDFREDARRLNACIPSAQLDLLGERWIKEPLVEQQQIDRTQALDDKLTQTPAYRVTHDQRSSQRRGGHRNGQQDRQIQPAIMPKIAY